MGKTTISSLTLTVSPIGSGAVTFYLPEPLQENYPLILNDLAECLKAAGVIDCVSAYHSILAIFDPAKHSLSSLTGLLENRLPQALSKANTVREQRLIRIPVCYEESFAPDLAELAEKAALSVPEVIKYHTEQTYTVCCLGFIPGFAFLGYVDDEIATPRRADPRTHVAAGSVGIAGRQTGIYPAESPGGWNIIGQTPIVLYAPEKQLYSRFEMGDAVQFYAITTEEFAAWESQND